MTATAAAGFGFTNWMDGSGNLLTNRAALQFTMATNLALTANFVDIQKPTLSIVSPTLNQQWSNATFTTVSGKAGDNVAVGAVYYSLNGGIWTNATTANNWTNWTGSLLTLNPGTNTLQAYAVDTSGNLSPTNTVRFEYVVLMPLSVSINGKGTVSPNYNGKLLAINENYTMTAIAPAGSAFTNWTDGSGNLLTNRAALRFTMATNLALTANFVDIQKPTLSIVSPTLNQQWSNATFTVSRARPATTSPSVPVYFPFASTAAFGPTPPPPTTETNWTGSLLPTLNPGTNTLQRLMPSMHQRQSLPHQHRVGRRAGQSRMAGRARTFGLILAAMVCARTCAMAFNRIVDRKFDALNPHNPAPFALGQIGLASATMLCVLSGAGFVLAELLVEFGVFYFVTARPGDDCFYSLTKRFTDYTHVFLGLSLALGPIGAWLAVKEPT